MSLWTHITAAQATIGKASGTWEAQRVEIDSRRVQKGDLFVAIVGERVDGHAFVGAALAAGAAAVMVSKSGFENFPSLRVPDTLKALQDMGRFARRHTRARIVGVTGSVGKTSLKEMLKLTFEAHGRTHASTGNFNNHIGTPLNLANLDEDTELAVFEMGMNHAGEISFLTKMVRPHVSVITNVESVHLEFFVDEEAIAHAKAEIFEGVSHNGAAVLNSDNRHFEYLALEARRHGIPQVIACGEYGEPDCRLLNYEATAEGSHITASIFGHSVSYKLGAIGRHWVMTSLLTLGVSHALGLELETSAAALAQFKEPEGRGRLAKLAWQGGELFLIDDSYNASPAAMRAAFAKLNEAWEATGKKGRKIAALGNMLELGEDAAGLHARLAGDAVRAGVDVIVTAGELMQHLQENMPETMRGGHVAQASQVPSLLFGLLRAGDILLIKGSHGSKMYEVAPQLTQEKTQAASKGDANAV